MKRFPRGSEWRKWDLHVHIPEIQKQIEWDRFCSVIHDSDVYAVGITDYFTLNSFFTFQKHYSSLYPDCEKIFFPNLELRLNETVNGSSELVHFHIIFLPDLTPEQATEFLKALKTQNTDSKGKKQSCDSLKTSADFENATVSRNDIAYALENTFGKELSWNDHVILIAASNNDGIRADKNSKRKMNIADQIDKLANAFFGNQTNTDYFLKLDRYDDKEQISIPKPVFAGCDAHTIDDLQAWLGKEINNKNNRKYVTWIKADLTYEGLLQTLVEPAERVKIQSFKPDEKEPYRVISKIIFNDNLNFPNEVMFNPGLNAIIGSRSSGKSSLLAYIAHAVDPEYTVSQQMATAGNRSEVGPGASITWDDVKDFEYKVEWEAPETKSGQVIYIPQNSLFAISERPEEITAKIQPVVFRLDPEFETKFQKTLSDIQNINGMIRDAVDRWFSLNSEIKILADDIRGLGDIKAIIHRRDELAEQIRILSETTTLTDDEVRVYQDIIDKIYKNEALCRDIDEERQNLNLYVKFDSEKCVYKTTDQIKVNISMDPTPTMMSKTLQDKLHTLIEDSRTSLSEKLSSTLIDYRSALDTEYNNIVKATEKIRSDNKELIKKYHTNDLISTLLRAKNDQNAALIDIENKTDKINSKISDKLALLAIIEKSIKTRYSILDTLVTDFNRKNYSLENMLFNIESGFDPDEIEKISSGFNKSELSPYINKSRIALDKVHAKLGEFIEYMASGKQKLNRGENAISLTKEVLTITEDIRFWAELESDRIGGFGKSSMTPGKQALFALTLILADSDDLWPLLIDQPEDDLDSRSICDVIVKDLMKRKRERQIIMVTHDANLAIGADSEEIIVANRHGDDRPNVNSKMFAYLTGSLEYSKPWDKSTKCILESAGIREHACEILDGGAKAFQKRKEKYRI